MQNPEGLINAGVLTVGSYLAYPPQAFTDQVSHQPTGFDIDLITEIAKRLGLKVNVVNMPYTTLIDSIVHGDLDVAIAAIPITDMLRTKVHLIPYFKGGEALMVPWGNPSHIGSLDDLCGKKVAALKDSLEQSDLKSTSTSCVEAGRPSIDVKLATSYEEMMDNLYLRHIDATFLDLPQAGFYAAHHPQHVEQTGPLLNVTPEGIAVNNDDANDLYLAIASTLTILQRDGTYQRLIKKWGLTEGTIL
ncbi:transporter substrate-binding domain-containing protein [Ktedonospora formicarum]|uniref:Solute-binding protein family 3/N-terminal domain-containing protein n=1 Tax=Ktedonospora formicarum TaxID=2778364 RepID=A0A8J3I1B8_9CHLR|nr:transporter substrate-binding domain-containing protein [Ktedonospora formicarum]GHO44253.1 hypothetical protein KSX_24160 [Ktedonospora formicarum]